MKVLIISPTTDFAGVGINLKRALDAAGWRARHVARKVSPYGYPMDIHWRGGDRELNRRIRELHDKADVVHVMDNPAILSRFTRRRQAVVVQHLGTRYREDSEGITALCRLYGATEITDSFDLMVYPHVRFVPVAVDTRALWATRRRVYQDSDVIRIAHAPTDRATSDTDVVIETVERLAREFPIELDLIEGVPNAECIERKARADIYIDRMGIGFGVNAIECWAMGIPVVSGFVDPSVTTRARAEFGYLPWLDATRETMYTAVRSLVTSAPLRHQYAQLGREHAERWHSPQAVVERVTAIYSDSMAVAA